MIEREGDLWEIGEAEDAAVVITTNGSVRRDGCAVMGRGCALEAKQKFPGLDRRLGEALERGGNRLYLLRSAGVAGSPPTIFSFPVKAEWHQHADLGLIARSAGELVAAADLWRRDTVVMPRPGCGNGRLRWAVVKPILEPLLDDRFIVVHRPGEV